MKWDVLVLYVYVSYKKIFFKYLKNSKRTIIKINDSYFGYVFLKEEQLVSKLKTKIQKLKRKKKEAKRNGKTKVI